MERLSSLFFFYQLQLMGHKNLSLSLSLALQIHATYIHACIHACIHVNANANHTTAAEQSG